MYLGNLSFDLLQKYLGVLSTCGLLEERNGLEKTFMVTEKGQRFLVDYHELEKHTEAVELKKRLLERSLTAA